MKRKNESDDWKSAEEFLMVFTHLLYAKFLFLSVENDKLCISLCKKWCVKS